MGYEGTVHERTALLIGDEGLERLSRSKVIIFGVGGVGSWCAEALVRSGIGSLTMVDPDSVSLSNVNRQLMATTQTVGKPKVEVLAARLRVINPDATITPIISRYSAETAQRFNLSEYDCIVDAIDSLKDKALLISNAAATGKAFFSSMGAALKTDPTKVRVAEFRDVRGCPLGAALRKKLRKEGNMPENKFLCVYDDEVLPRLGDANGSMVHITGIFGFTLAGLVIRSLTSI